MNYRDFQKKYYEKVWSTASLKDEPDSRGWLTRIPAKDFFDFLDWLKTNKIKGRVLDVGCGAGRHALAFAQAGFDVEGIDFSLKAIVYAKAEAIKAGVSKHTKFSVGDILNLPYENESCDIVNDDGCFHHIAPEDWDHYLKNILRALKRNGIYRLKVFSKNCDYYTCNKNDTDQRWILLKHKDYTYFFEEHELVELLSTHFEIIQLYEQQHYYDTSKKFYFVICKKK